VRRFTPPTVRRIDLRGPVRGVNPGGVRRLDFGCANAGVRDQSLRLQTLKGACRIDLQGAVRGVHGGAALRTGLHGASAAARVERLRAAVASYSGHLRHGQSWGQWAQAWEQYAWLGVLFSRRGWQVEERWPQRSLAERVLRLRTAYQPRAGYALAAGFPGWLRRHYEARALGKGFAVAVVRETGDRAGACKERRVVEVFVPLLTLRVR